MFPAPPIGTMATPSASRARPRRSANASSASWSLTPSTSTTDLVSLRAVSIASQGYVGARRSECRLPGLESMTADYEAPHSGHAEIEAKIRGDEASGKDGEPPLKAEPANTSDDQADAVSNEAPSPKAPALATLPASPVCVDAGRHPDREARSEGVRGGPVWHET
jgi:hypothetical protein